MAKLSKLILIKGASYSIIVKDYGLSKCSENPSSMQTLFRSFSVDLCDELEEAMPDPSAQYFTGDWLEEESLFPKPAETPKVNGRF